MSFDWTSSDSSKHCNEQTSSMMQGSSQGQSSQPSSSKTGGLLGINDFDFETLIEILGTNGDSHKREAAKNLPKIQEAATNEGLQMDIPEPELDSAPPYLDERDPILANNHDRKSPSPVAINSPPLVSGDKGLPNPINNATTTRKESSSKGTNRPKKKPSTQIVVPQQCTAPHTTRSDKINATANVRPSFSRLSRDLGIAVTEAKDQVTDLRTKLQALKDEVKTMAPHLYHRAFEDPHNRNTAKGPVPRTAIRDEVKYPPIDEIYNGNTSQIDGKVVPLATERDLVAALTEEETRRGLTNICRILNIDPTTLIQPTQGSKTYAGRDQSPNLDDILRSLKLVRELDGLVWKRSESGDTHAMGHTNSSTYSEENIQSILDHIRLWERTARSRTKRTNSTT